jgi:hypothetical protein
MRFSSRYSCRFYIYVTFCQGIRKLIYMCDICHRSGDSHTQYMQIIRETSICKAHICSCVCRTILKNRKPPTFVSKSFLKKRRKFATYGNQDIDLYGIRQGPIPIPIKVDAWFTICRQYK